MATQYYHLNCTIKACLYQLGEHVVAHDATLIKIIPSLESCTLAPQLPAYMIWHINLHAIFQAAGQDGGKTHHTSLNMT